MMGRATKDRRDDSDRFINVNGQHRTQVAKVAHPRCDRLGWHPQATVALPAPAFLRLWAPDGLRTPTTAQPPWTTVLGDGSGHPPAPDSGHPPALQADTYPRLTCHALRSAFGLDTHRHPDPALRAWTVRSWRPISGARSWTPIRAPALGTYKRPAPSHTWVPAPRHPPAPSPLRPADGIPSVLV